MLRRLAASPLRMPLLVGTAGTSGTGGTAGAVDIIGDVACGEDGDGCGAMTIVFFLAALMMLLYVTGVRGSCGSSGLVDVSIDS